MSPTASITILGNAVATNEGFGMPGSVASDLHNPGNLNAGDVGGGVSTHGETNYPDDATGQAALNNQLNTIATGTNPKYNAYAQSLGLQDSSQLTLAQVGKLYAEDPNWASKVSNISGIDQNATMAQIASGQVSANNVSAPINNAVLSGPTASLVSPASDSLQFANASTTAATTITGSSAFVPNADPELQIDTGLSGNPWYNDRNLITGNPNIRNSVTPISFTVYLDQYRLNQVLHVPNSNTPIQVQLNCSLREITIESKHIVNRVPSRTGMHITMWGMAPDLITGSGSTGVFMNQAGITDLYSTTVAPAGTDINSYATLSANRGNFNATEAYRVGAQDAFVEFLKLFQMNGVTWFHRSYQAYQSPMNSAQVGDDAWSPVAGASTFQQNARNNDVLNRGYVSMTYKNNQFLGYFKSLNWTQDAEKPFSWEFNFSFQVERTFTALYYPSSSTPSQSGTPTPANYTGPSSA